jgi:hypothetical protein
LVSPDSGTQPESAAPPLWKAVMAAIPNVFGRLVYLQSLGEQSDRLIGHSHQQVFSHWLMLGLSEQIRDLREYFEHCGGAGVDYRVLVPANARDVERLLYLTDMETLLGLLRVEGADNIPAI